MLRSFCVYVCTRVFVSGASACRDQPIQYDEESHHADAVMEFLRLNVIAGCKHAPAAPEEAKAAGDAEQEL